LQDTVGSAYGDTQGLGSIYSRISFSTKDHEVLGRAPPRKSKLLDCPDDCPNLNAAGERQCVIVDFSNLKMSKSKLSWLVNTAVSVEMLEEVIHDLLEGLVEDTVLTDLVMKDLLVELFDELMLGINKDRFDPWINATKADIKYDPLAPEGPMLHRLEYVTNWKNQPEPPQHTVNLWNLTDPGNWIVGLVRTAVDDLLNVQPNTDGEFKYSDLGVNKIINGITNDTGTLELADLNLVLMEGTNEFSTHKLTMDKIEISGLNTFTYFDVLRPISPYSVNQLLKLDNFSIEFDFTLVIDAAEDTD
jgi:hypothetical protein